MPQRTSQSFLIPALLALLAACSGDPDAGTDGGGTSSGGEATASGGTNTGGAASDGDGTNTGGATSGGGSNTGGATSDSDGRSPARPSMGCGSTTPAASGTYTIDVDGAEREYILTLPDDYDSSNPYPLIFGWHPLGGSAQGVANPGFGTGGYYGLQSRANGSVIFVAGNGLPDGDGNRGWPNTNNRDIRFLEEMLDRFRSELCIDESRILSTGFSYGGMMSMTISCRMGQIFRAVAPMAGMLIGAPYSSCVDEPLAALIIHGVNDGVESFGVGVKGSRDFRDYLLETNNCSDSSMPVDPSPCQDYSGCDTGYPVTYCEFDGEHTIPNFASGAIWDFFSQFL